MTRRIGWVALFALALVFETAPAAAKPLGLAPDLASPVFSVESTASAGGTVSYQGGPVLHANRTHLIFWEPANRPELRFESGYMPLMQRFLRDVARASHSARSLFGITGQYRDGFGPAAYASTYAGSVVDSDPLPAGGCLEPPPPAGPAGWVTCLTDRQLRQELARVLAADHLPARRNDVYFLVTPDLFGSCAGAGPDRCALGGSQDQGYCGYHSWLNSGLLYAVIPYNAVPGHCQSGNPRPNGNPADPALSTLAHELAETVTDPRQDAWLAADGSEIADLCITSFGQALGGSGSTAWNEKIAGGHFWLQELYSRITGRCAPRPQPDSVGVVAPARIVAGQPARLIARAHQPGGRILDYNWNFGDHRGGRGRRPEHTYRRAGTYRVFLRVTDSAGNWAYAKRTVTVTPR